jgi:hypothetical protein
MDGDDRISFATALEAAIPGGDARTRQAAFRHVLPAETAGPLPPLAPAAW